MILDVFRNMFILTQKKELFKMKVISEIDHMKKWRNLQMKKSTVRIVRRYLLHTNRLPTRKFETSNLNPNKKNILYALTIVQ